MIETENKSNDPEDFWVMRAMKKYGGSFVQALGEAATRADDNNLRRIKSTWPRYWAKYSVLGLKLRSDEAEKDFPAKR